MARDEFVGFDYELHRFKLLNVTHIKMSETHSQTCTFRNNSINEPNVKANTFLFYFLSFFFLLVSGRTDDKFQY